MKITMLRDNSARSQTWILTITDDERMRVDLDTLDKYTLDECDTPDASIADRLLGLELLARRIEEQEKTSS